MARLQTRVGLAKVREWLQCKQTLERRARLQQPRRTRMASSSWPTDLLPVGETNLAYCTWWITLDPTRTAPRRRWWACCVPRKRESIAAYPFLDRRSWKSQVSSFKFQASSFRALQHLESRSEHGGSSLRDSSAGDANLHPGPRGLVERTPFLADRYQSRSPTSNIEEGKRTPQELRAGRVETVRAATQPTRPRTGGRAGAVAPCPPRVSDCVGPMPPSRLADPSHAEPTA